ncbi:ABC transporter ATP-binding protein [Microbacterium luticocti]|uniref:ABC transporter ATP-binding protein n=1 Tax=Microbacterium luticocti TaxID=451764 RepID=UPI000A03A43C|nr:ABC transporter ATP-binding protein [Microbacterium luticocti]
MDGTDARLSAHGVRLAYDGRTVVPDLDLAIPDGGFTVIAGPNACGKSTLLRALARLLTPQAGQVRLDGTPIGDLRSREVARRLALLPQQVATPDGIAVTDLVARGRFPHQRLLRQWTSADADAVDEALRVTGVADLAGRHVDELSGGQRQRVLLAMTLAQGTGILLLDEPTTFLDMAHQVEVLELCRRLHAAGRTIVAVLHDINQACRYATHLVAMREGAIVAQGDPAGLVDAALIERVFGLRARVLPDPVTGTPMVVPLAGWAVSDTATEAVDPDAAWPGPIADGAA